MTKKKAAAAEVVEETVAEAVEAEAVEETTADEPEVQAEPEVLPGPVLNLAKFPSGRRNA